MGTTQTKRGTVANYMKKCSKRGQNDVPCNSHNHSTLLGVLWQHIGNIFVK